MTYAQLLLEWFEENKRDMPWRRTSDPYCIWVSEIMLQQTQVITVIPYYLRFIERFPNVTELAKANLEEVHTYWQGLGYYRRGENLWKGAKLIEEKWGGKFPTHPELIKEIPGIGPYTLGAICSIAFNLPLPAVDGNVMRILARQFCIEADIGVAKNRKIFEEKVMELMPANPNQFNQALMELGALVCTPKSPKCDCCPMQGSCEAHLKGREESYPVKAKKVKVEEETYYLVILKKGNLYGVEKRPAEGLLANLWSVPMIEAVQWEKAGIDEYELTTLKQVKHVFTHRKWYMAPVIIEWSQKVEQKVQNNKTNASNIEYFTLEQLQSMPIGTAIRKVIKELEIYCYK